jgi:hypothetical protein
LFALTRGSFARPVQIGACAFGVWLLGALILSAQTSLLGAAPLSTSNGVLSPGASFVNTADPAVPDAEEVVVDVPSVFHWARYQRGEINGWRYALYPDGSGTVARVDDVLEKPFTMDCQSGVSCTITRPDDTSFSVPATFSIRPVPPVDPKGEGVAQYLAEWVLAGTGKPKVVTLPLRLDLPKLAAQRPAPKPTVPQIAALPQLPVGTAQAAAQVLDGGGTARLAAAEGASLPLEIAGSDVAEPDNAEPEGPAPLCAQPDPFIPTLCLDPHFGTKEAAPESSANGVAAPAGRSTKEESGSALAGGSPSRKATAARKPAKPDGYLDRIGLDCSLTGSTSLGYVASGSSSSSIGKPRLSLGCNKKITDKLSLRFSLLKYVIPGHQSDFDPDFTYAFTYLHSDELTFSYSNYSGRFGGADGGILNALADGTLRGSYKLPKINLPNNKETACSASLRLPNPINDSLNISCGYAVTDKLRLNGTLNLYRPHAQGEYDPDYTYTASYRVNKDLVITYSNYSNNRFPWNKGNSPGPGLSGGSLSFSYALKF